MSTLWAGKGGWTLTRDHDRLILVAEGVTTEYVGVDASRLAVRRGWFRGVLTADGPTPLELKGLQRRQIQCVRTAINEIVVRGKFGARFPRAALSRAAFDQVLNSHLAQQRWIAHDTAKRILTGIPTSSELLVTLTPTELSTLTPLLTDDERQTLDFLDDDHRSRVAATNDEILRREAATRKSFFDSVERSPLTAEQVSAVVTFDNRVRVIAAAGSGKTSVMVARAAYAIDRGFVPADRILMLAFNADAARELQERVNARLAILGLPTVGLRASTFHAFGLSLIGKVTGRKPSIAPWVESGKDTLKIEEIVDELRESSPDFRFKWDAFRLLYGRMSDEPDGGEPDSYDRSTRLTGFQTFRGETVRSEGERLIADWLFLNGVNYDYERPYAHDVADSDHSQYRPDFFYPDAQVWHEHWALRADGTPPASFTGYAESMRWKKQIHQQYGTTLVETKWHEIIDLSGFDALERDLSDQGLHLDWNPDRPIPGAKPLEHERLARLVRTFMSHVKSGSLTREDLEARLSDQPKRNNPRTRLFLDLYWRIHDRWQAELRAINAVDFDDMLLQAAELVEGDPDLARYDLVMVDEFQDTSRARARLTRALMQGNDKHLLAVGDDWQAINRFAGADLSAMTDFASYFGPAQTRRLQTTFRCTQTIADVASRFVSRNPAQIAKTVKSARGDGGPPVTIVRVPNREAIPGAVQEHLTKLATENSGISVDVLGRYRFEQDLVRRREFPQLDVTFRTVHRSKGLEADYVILPNLTAGTFGFPSQISDDPVLALAMSDDDGFPHSEERRLFYVALTRARHGVTIFTVTGLESPFIVELLKDPGVVIDGAGATTEDVLVCPACGQGTLVRRKGPYGDFLGCSRFPKCRQTARL
ncbi:UvrD-helicase domain-containing protein [Aeromicrobium sp.]|uniref:UvrD-helicase domain-containing protein n=1 Tax=Aeromicrobium sp. TaxID=1871063 RepID=UPI0028AEE4EC|nr:UvrD-helicase domain-containing protein [Aeromicrobium sp.]